MSDDAPSHSGSYRRRRVLGALGAAAAASLAGCGASTNSSPGDPSDKQVPPPTVDAPDRWRLTTPESEPRLLQKGSTFALDYQAVGHIRRYEDQQLRTRIREETFGEVDRPFAVAFAARIDIFPGLASVGTGFVNDQINESLRTELQDAMRAFGVQNVQRQAPMDASNTPAGEVQVITGEYPIDPVSIDASEIPHSDRNKIEFGGGTLPIKGIIGRWKTDGSIMAGGAVYPNGQFAASNTIEMSAAISLTLDIDLRLRPQRRERQALSFIDSISR